MHRNDSHCERFASFHWSREQYSPLPKRSTTPPMLRQWWWTGSVTENNSQAHFGPLIAATTGIETKCKTFISLLLSLSGVIVLLHGYIQANGTIVRFILIFFSSKNTFHIIFKWLSRMLWNLNRSLCFVLFYLRLQWLNRPVRWQFSPFVLLFRSENGWANNVCVNHQFHCLSR